MAKAGIRVVILCSPKLSFVAVVLTVMVRLCCAVGRAQGEMDDGLRRASLRHRQIGKPIQQLTTRGVSLQTGAATMGPIFSIFLYSERLWH